MSTYLVTGAAGFIGSKVCELLQQQGHEVVGIDNLNDYYDVRLKDWRLGRLLGRSVTGGGATWSEYACPATGTLPEAVTAPGFTFYPLDIENSTALDALFERHRFAAVFNLAARAGVRYSMENPYVYLSTNTMGTLNLLECQRKHKVSKIVLASTSSLYAGCAMPFSESLPVNTPLSPYAASKKAAELMAYSYHKLYGMDVTVVRYFTVFGPAGRPDMSIFRFIKWIDEEQPIELFGDGSQARDFTYVDDIASGTIAAARPLGYEIINLGGGRNPVSLKTIIETLENLLGRKAVISGQPFHVADIKETWADISKAWRLLGWKPTVDLARGLQESVSWYLANRSWLRGIKL